MFNFPIYKNKKKLNYLIINKNNLFICNKMSNWTPSVYKGDILDDDIHKIINASIKSDKIYSENVDKRLSSIIRLGAGVSSSASVSSSAGASYRASAKASAYVSADTNIDINDKVIYISDDEEEEKDK